MKENDISKNIKGVLAVFLVCFLGLVSYMTYFEIFKSNYWKESPQNIRKAIKNNEVLRGKIYDRNNEVLAQSERIDNLNQKREYPQGAPFAHVIGFVNSSGGKGVELLYSEELTSIGLQQAVSSIIGNNKNKIGKNLVTTLDGELQKYAYELLGNRKGSVVAIDPKTGEILTEVSTPSFDPDKLSENWDKISKDEDNPLTNRAVAGLYPPGSTFKVVTAVSALENISGVQNRTFDDTGKIKFNSKESLSNYNGRALGQINLKEAFMYSSNVVFGKLGMELGNSKLKATADKFYFNKNIPADGILIEDSVYPSLKNSQSGDQAQSAIGQSSVLVTPMQMALIASTIANDGVMMKPHLVKSILTSEDKNIKDISPQKLADVTSPEVANTVKDYMRSVITSGTGRDANIKGLNICGKTGTADHKEGKNKNAHSWFIGFAPYDDPKVAVAVIVEEGESEGAISTRIATQFIQKALNK